MIDTTVVAGATSDTETFSNMQEHSTLFEPGIHSEAEAMEMDEEPGLVKTFDDLAFEAITSNLRSQPKLHPRKPIWEDKTNYQRGLYKPNPHPIQWGVNKGSGTGRYDDSDIVSKLWSEQHRGGMTTDSEAEADTEEQAIDKPIRKRVQIVENNKENEPSAFRPVSPAKKVTIVEKPRKGRRKKKKTKDAPKIMEPGLIDFNQYGMMAQLWMEQVDKKNVKKSKTMYIAVMPEDQKPPEALAESLPKYDMTSDDVFLPPQWVVARGRSLRRRKKEANASQSSFGAANRSFASESEGEGMGPDRPMSPGRQMLLFFRIGNNWKDLAWVLFEGLLSDSETIRLIKDIQLKNPGEIREQVNDMMNRWWKKRGSDATIEELQRALDLVHMGYVRDEYFDYRASVTTYTDTEDDLDISEISDNDPDVSRLIGEFEVRSLNNSFEVENSADNRPYSISSEGIQRRLSEKSLNASTRSSRLDYSRDSIGRPSVTSERHNSLNISTRSARLDTSRDSIGRPSVTSDKYNTSQDNLLDDTFDSTNKFLIIQPQLKQTEVSTGSRIHIVHIPFSGQ